MREAIPGIQAQLPAGMKVGVPYDATAYIQDAIDEVLSTLTETLLIVIIVIFLFLGSMRSVLIPVMAIPISLDRRRLPDAGRGFTINLLTLLAIVLSVGLVVDDAIVMVENVERHMHMGKTPFRGGHGRRARTGGSDHRDDDHPGRCLRADRYSGRADRRAVPRVRIHARRRGHRLRRRGADAFADDGIEAAARGRHRTRLRRMVNRRFERVRRCYTRKLAGTLRYRPVVLTLVGDRRCC